MATSHSEAARNHAEYDSDEDEKEASMVVLCKDGHAENVFDSDWRDARFESLPPGSGHWVLEDIRIVDLEQDYVELDGKKVENGDSHPVIAGTWRVATEDDLDGEDLVPAVECLQPR